MHQRFLEWRRWAPELNFYAVRKRARARDQKDCRKHFVSPKIPPNAIEPSLLA